MPISDSFIQQLHEKLKNELPGAEAQYRMAPATRPLFNTIPKKARSAAVLLFLYPNNNEWHTVFIQRTSHNPNDRHGGQISFPGGKVEDSDPSLEFTAIRETAEEVGVDASLVQTIGPLSELYIPVSNFKVNPFVAYALNRPDFVPDKKEVQAILEVPIWQLLEKNNIKKKDLRTASGFMLKDVPYFDIGGTTIWGATAMILSEFLELFRKVKLEI